MVNMAEVIEKTVVKRAINGLVDTFCHNLDPKKRLTVPSEWRDALGNPTYVYVMPSASEDCLELIPAELMERTLQQYQSADIFDEEADADAQAIAQFAQMLKVDAPCILRIAISRVRWRTAYHEIPNNPEQMSTKAMSA